MNPQKSFMDLLRDRYEAGMGLCVGLDSDYDAIPQSFKDEHGPNRGRVMAEFSIDRIQQTNMFVCAYMADHNFYLAQGVEGLVALEQTIRSVRLFAPNVPFIFGSYAGGVFHSNVALARYAFDCMGADAITLNPWFGQEAMQPILSRSRKGIIVTCRTSNYGAAEFQDLFLADHDNVPLYKTVAHRVAAFWNERHNCGLLMGPMVRGELRRVREVAEHLPIFVTGIGTQSKTRRIEEEDVEEIVTDGRSPRCFWTRGAIVCSSRGVIFASGPSGPHEEAARLHGLIAKYRKALSNT